MIELPVKAGLVLEGVTIKLDTGRVFDERLSDQPDRRLLLGAGSFELAYQQLLIIRRKFSGPDTAMSCRRRRPLPVES